VPPAATLRILIRDFESDAFNSDGTDFITPLRLQFSNFFVESIAQGSHRSFERARKFFSEAMYGDCFIERPYHRIPPKKTHTGVGAIEDAPEELLIAHHGKKRMSGSSSTTLFQTVHHP
jgi:hypothetical protein